MSVDYVVVAMGKHADTGVNIYAIEQKNEAIYGGNPVYLIDGRGIRKI